MQFIVSLLTWQNLIHLIDILVIWFLIYELLMLIRGTRAVQLFRGILIIILVKIVSWYVGLSTVSWVMDQIINWGVIAIVIIFQPEIRRGLEHLGRGTFFTHNQTANEKEEDDKTRKEQLDLRNEVYQLLFQTDKTLEEIKGKVSDDEVKKAEDARDALKKAQEENNVEDMKAKKDDLTKIIQDMSVKLYQQAQQAQGQAQADGASASETNAADDNTVDGDFKEVDPDDK